MSFSLKSQKKKKQLYLAQIGIWLYQQGSCTFVSLKKNAFPLLLKKKRKKKAEASEKKNWQISQTTHITYISLNRNP